METESSRENISQAQNITKPYPCHCPPNSEPGIVLLFYRYFANNPVLPAVHAESAKSPEDLATFHRTWASGSALTGKLRVAPEGFNVTIAGTASNIKSYIDACRGHWSFAALPLSTEDEKNTFFKPTPGCSCVFKDLNVKVCEEITPMGVTGYAPRDWSAVREIAPPEWHDLLTSSSTAGGDGNGKEIVLLDVRNHYESSLGYFTSSCGDPAIRPQVRRFSQFPQYIKRRRLEGQLDRPKRILGYCTGGIRCEKATRFLAENAPTDGVEVLTLKGGIAAYLSWMDGEIRAGRLKAIDSSFKGRNYVFDGRGSVGLEGGGEEVVGLCHGCGSPADGMRKCRSAGCHLELVVCCDCGHVDVLCCHDCRLLEAETVEGKIGKRPMCECERTREMRLWGEEGERTPSKQNWKNGRRKELMGRERTEQANIKVQIIQSLA